MSHLIDSLNEWLGSIPGVTIGHAIIAADIALGIAFRFSGPWSQANGAVTGLVSISLLLLLQHSANRGNAALHAKMDVAIAASRAPNDVIGTESSTEREIRQVRDDTLSKIRNTD